MMNMVPWKTQNMSPTYLLTNSKYPRKLLVVMHHSSAERMKDTTGTFTTWQEQEFLTAINIQINGVVQQRCQKKSIYANYTVH